jgi:hypothetical protein
VWSYAKIIKLADGNQAITFKQIVFEQSQRRAVAHCSVLLVMLYLSTREANFLTEQNKILIHKTRNAL